MKRRWRKGFLVFMLLQITGCSIRPGLGTELPSYEERLPLRVAVQKYYISSVIGYICDQNLDETFGLELIPVSYPSGAEQISDMDQDKYDVATIGAAFLQPLIEDKAVIIGEHIVSRDGNSVYVRKDSPIAGVKGFNPTYPELLGDLNTVRGSTILMKKDTTLQYVGMKWLESIGVKEEFVDIQYMDFGEIYDSFQKGYGDVAILSAPYSYDAEEEGMVEAGSSESLRVNIYEVLAAPKKAHEEKREALKRFLQLILYANESLERDFQKKMACSRSWYEKNQVPFTESVLEKECEGKAFVTRQNYQVDTFGEYEKDYAEYMAATGNITPRDLENVEKNIDRELFREVFLQ